MIRFRRGLLQDYAPAMKLVAEFAEESLGEYGTYLDPDKLQKTFDIIFKTSFVAILDSEVVGILGGQVIEDICSKHPVYEEVVWYMRKEHRKYGMQLLAFVEEWCRIKGIHRIIMSCMHNSKTEKLFALYERLGFRPMETRFIREVE